MPSTPYIVSGTVSNATGSVVEGVLVVLNNTTTGTFCSGVTDSLGKYAIDLANAGWILADSITAYVRDGKYFGEATFTIAGTSYTQNLTVKSISASTIRDKSWLALYDLLQSGTYEISTDNIYGAMNDKLVSEVGYPLVIISPPNVSNTKLMLNRDGIREATINFNIMVYHTSQANVKTLADEISYNIDKGWNNLAGQGLKNLNFEQDDYDYFTDGERGTIHVYNIPVSFRYVIV